MKKGAILYLGLITLMDFLGEPCMAQSFVRLYKFSGGSDGETPLAGFVQSGQLLYGSTSAGGDSGSGTIFSLGTDGVDYVLMHSFTGADGASPTGPLVSANGELFGTTREGGDWAEGTVFRYRLDSSELRVLYSFSGGVDGASPYGGVIEEGHTLYGTTRLGGTAGVGTVFRINDDGTGFTTIHSFMPSKDGANPTGALTLSGGLLFGTTSGGGVLSGAGTVFAMDTNGSQFNVLHTFFTASDGGFLAAGVLVAGKVIYGTTPILGTKGNGTLFKLHSDGTGFTVMHTFSTTYPPNGVNEDGANPRSGLALSGNRLYGTTKFGGMSGLGTLFAISTNGSGFTNLYSFSSFDGSLSNINGDGAEPQAELLVQENSLIGTAAEGGDGFGTAFALSLPVESPQLSISKVGSFVVLTWSTNAVGFVLQFATDILNPTWVEVATAPAIVNGENAVTNIPTSEYLYFRLSN